MRARARRFGPTLTLLGILIVGAGPAEAGFLGLTVHGEYLYPNASTVYQDLGSQLITPGFTFDFTTPGVKVGVNNDSIVTDYGGTAFGAAFNGFRLTVVGPDPGITGVTIDPTSIAGFDASRLSFTSNSIAENLQGLAGKGASSIILDVRFAAASVPEPPGLAMAALGLLLVAGWARSRRGRTSPTGTAPRRPR
jgi:hypothetical protein